MATEPLPPAPPPAELAEIREVVARAKSGDPDAVPRLRELFDRHPLLWRTCGDLAAQAQHSWVALAAGSNLHLNESITRYAAKLRAELSRPSAPEIEALLVERVVATWLEVNYFSAMESNANNQNTPLKVLDHRAKRHAQAGRQHERAVATLALVQRLSRVAVPAAGPTTQGPGVTSPSRAPGLALYVAGADEESARPAPVPAAG